MEISVKTKLKRKLLKAILMKCNTEIKTETRYLKLKAKLERLISNSTSQISSSAQKLSPNSLFHQSSKMTEIVIEKFTGQQRNRYSF